MLSEGEAEGELILELRRLAGRSEGDAFSVQADGVSVAVRYTSGSSSSLALTTPYRRGATPPVTTGSYRGAPARAPSAPRPLCVELRRESYADTATKERGVDREVQTGDRAFDDEVYIDTRAPDDAVRWVLGPDEVRAAVRELLDLGFQRVRIDDDGLLTAYLSTFASRASQKGRAAKMVAAMARLARGVPWVESAGAPPPDRAKRLGIWLLVAAGVGFFAEFLWSFGAAPPGCVTSDDDGSSLHCIVVAGQNCCAPMGYGFLFGVPLGIVLAVAAVQPIRGRSNSSNVRVMVGLGVLGLVVDLALVVAERLMWK